METEKMLPPEVTIEQEKLIIAVAKHTVNTCHCYGHLCGHCQDARKLLEMCGLKVSNCREVAVHET